MTLVRTYLAQRGLFARVGRKLGLDPSYISRIANGKRHSERISLAIEAELNKTDISNRKISKSSGKRSVSPASKKSQRTSH
jgi:hypothetical protein